MFRNRITQGLAKPGETLDDLSKPSTETTTTNLPPPPPINIRLETVIKITEVRRESQTKKKQTRSILLGNVPCSCLCSISSMAIC